VTDLKKILDEYNVQLTLLDLGASGGLYSPFEQAASIGTLIEVDPDPRDFSDPADQDAGRRTQERIRVRKAITEDENATSVRVYLTKSPHCSSTLKGDFSRLRNFPYTDLFTIVDEQDLPATSLNRLAAELGTEFHWIKIDTQGTELRIIRSLSPALLASLCACDAEISLYRHYLGADWFPDFHRFMDDEGFYISDIVTIQQRLRLTAGDQVQMQKVFPAIAEMKLWPTSPEFRYLRVVNVGEPIEDLSRFLRIWCISFLTENYVHCFFLVRRLAEQTDTHQGLVDRLMQLLEEANSKRI
jgi:FkbM family methyltransferase